MPRDEVPLDDPIRVLFVNTKRQPPLGADTWIHLQIMRNIDRSRVEVHAACARGPRRRPTPTYQGVREISDLSIVQANFGREMSSTSLLSRALSVLSLLPAAWSVARLAWYIRRHGIAIIHTADRPRDAAVSVFLSRITRTRCVVHAHVGFDPSWMRPILQRSIRSADARLAISEFVAQTLRDGGCDSRSTYVVLNGIDLAQWQPRGDRDAIRRELGIDGLTPVVLTVCRLFRAKGVTELVQAIHDLRDDVPTATLLVVGDETEAGYLNELRASVRSYDLDDRVRFLGRREDVPALMGAADVFAMPSEYEPFGLVFAEAMAMTLPVVALDNGGTVEVVEHGSTGLLSASGDRQGLAANLRTLLLDHDIRAVFGRRGRARVEERFSVQRMAKDAVDAFATVLGEP